MRFNWRFAALLNAEATIMSGTPLHVNLSGTNYCGRGVRAQKEALNR